MSNISKTAFFATSPETVWAFLTEADKLAQWYHPSRTNLQANQDYELYNAETGERWVWGSVLEWEPPKKLVTTFIVPPLENVTSTVTWELEEAYGGTKLSLTHEGVGELGDKALGMLMALDAGWDEHLGKLRANIKAN